MITEIPTPDKEIEANITLIVRGKEWGVQIDNHITPIYCCNCEKQLENLYKLEGGRYGQVGTVNCKCGSEIHCVDSDNIVEYLDTVTTFDNKIIAKYYIDFKQLYRLNNTSWALLKDKVGYNILNEHKDKTVNLEDVVHQIISKFNLAIDNSSQYSTDKFHKLPIIINKWLGLLNSVEK